MSDTHFHFSQSFTDKTIRKNIVEKQKSHFFFFPTNLEKFP